MNWCQRDQGSFYTTDTDLQVWLDSVSPEEVGHAPVNTGTKHLQLTKHTTSPWDWASLYGVLYFAEENREAVFVEMTSVDKKKKNTHNKDFLSFFFMSSSWVGSIWLELDKH